MLKNVTIMENRLIRHYDVLPVERINDMGFELWPEPVIWIWPKDAEAESIEPNDESRCNNYPNRDT